MSDTPLDRLRHHVTGAIERGEKAAIESKPYVSSIVTRYGDLARVKADATVVNEILARQGSKFLIDLVAEQAGDTANKFGLSDCECKTLRDSLIGDFKNAIFERV